MLIRLSQIIRLPEFQDPDQQHLARMLSQMLGMTAGIGCLVVLAHLLIGPIDPPTGFVFGALLLLILVSYTLVRLKAVRVASVLFSFGLWVIVTLLILWTGGVLSPGFSGYILIIVLGRLILNSRPRLALISLTVLSGLAILAAEIGGVFHPVLSPEIARSTLILQVAIFISAILLLYVITRRSANPRHLARLNASALAEIRRQQQALPEYTQKPSDIMERRVIQLQVASEVARDATTIRELDDMLSRAVNLIRDRFGFYYAGIFLMDDSGEYALLKAATGEAGRSLLESGHRLKAGEVGIVGYVTGTGQARIASDVGVDEAHLQNPLLPETRSEMALPLKIGNQVIGALDVQSREPNAFGDDDVIILQTMADQLAVAIENARLLEATGRQLEELSVLHAVANAGAEASSEDTLLERATQMVGDSLYPDHFGVLLLDEKSGLLSFHPSYRGLDEETKKVAFNAQQGIVGRVASTGTPCRVEDTAREPDHWNLNPAMRSELCVPIKVGDRVIGVVNAESSQPHSFTGADERLLSTFAGQLATAIEKVRLLEALRRRAEELAIALAQREELVRLKSEFIQNVSHELRTPLTIVRGYVELLNNDEVGPLQPAQKDAMQIVERRVLMLSRLVDDLTTVLEAEARRVKQEKIDLSGMVQMMLADFQISARQAGLTLLTQIEPGLPPVTGNPVHLQRVLDNLIGNAIKFTPSGGKVSVSLCRDGATLELVVADTGVGIPPDKLERIFERFYQVDGSTTRRYGGTGLGLALVREIVELHGGTVAVESKLGAGSQFTVRLPVGEENP